RWRVPPPPASAQLPGASPRRPALVPGASPPGTGTGRSTRRSGGPRAPRSPAEERSWGHLVRRRGGPLPRAGAIPQVKRPTGPLHRTSLRVVLVITRAPWSVGPGESLVSAGLAGSDRWPSSVSGDGMVSRPAARIESRSCVERRQRRIGPIRGGPLARWRGPVLLSAGRVVRGGGPAGTKSGGTPRRFLLAIMWPPCSAAIPLNDRRHRYAMPEM